MQILVKNCFIYLFKYKKQNKYFQVDSLILFRFFYAVKSPSCIMFVLCIMCIMSAFFRFQYVFCVMKYYLVNHSFKQIITNQKTPTFFSTCSTSVVKAFSSNFCSKSFFFSLFFPSSLFLFLFRKHIGFLMFSREGSDGGGGGPQE